jgi:hypothetical protein
MGAVGGVEVVGFVVAALSAGVEAGAAGPVCTGTTGDVADRGGGGLDAGAVVWRTAATPGKSSAAAIARVVAGAAEPAVVEAFTLSPTS